MLKIHQPDDLEGLLKEVAKCLKDLLNYKLFSFALLENSTAFDSLTNGNSTTILNA